MCPRFGRACSSESFNPRPRFAADVIHYSTRRCSRLCISRRYRVYTRGLTYTHVGIHKYATHVHIIHMDARLRHPRAVSELETPLPEYDARTRAHCPHQVVLCNFSLDSHRPFFSRSSLSLFLSPPVLSCLFSVASSSYLFLSPHGQIRQCTALYTFVMTSVITSFLETDCAPKVCVDFDSKLLLD